MFDEQLAAVRRYTSAEMVQMLNGNVALHALVVVVDRRRSHISPPT